MSLIWRGTHHIVQSLSEYVLQVEYLRNEIVKNVHRTRQKFYHDTSLDQAAIITHVLSSETSLPVARLLKVVEDNGKLIFNVRWK